MAERNDMTAALVTAYTSRSWPQSTNTWGRKRPSGLRLKH